MVATRVTGAPGIGQLRRLDSGLDSLGAPELTCRYACGCEWAVQPGTLVRTGPGLMGTNLPEFCPEHPRRLSPVEVTLPDGTKLTGLTDVKVSGVCTHDWLDVTQLGSARKESVCRKCGAMKHDQPLASGGYASGTLGGQGWALAPAHIWGGSFSETRFQPTRELELAFAAEPIIGWRMWRIVKFERHGGIREPRLAPLTGRALWHPRVRFEAKCEPGNFIAPLTHGGYHEAPWPSCQCGVWAVRDRATAESKLSQRGLACFGEVYLWGRVLEFRHGWRARYAYPKRLLLYAADPAHETAAELERLYGVPAHVIAAPAARRGREVKIEFEISPEKLS